MIEQINKLIEINLLLMHSSTPKALTLVEFRNEQGLPLPGAKMLAEIMQQKELAKPHPTKEFSYELTELGKYIAESGGWLIHNDKLKRMKRTLPPEVKMHEKKSRKLKSELLIAALVIAFLSLLIVSCI